MPVVPFTARPNQSQPILKADPTFLMMAAAELHEAGRLVEPSLDITSQAQKADRQKTANDWPQGTSPEVRKAFDDRLKAGDITKDQYNKAMRDPRQFQDNP